MILEKDLLSSDQREQLVKLAEESNAQLEAAGQKSANQAFNLGCSASLLPAVISFVLIIILASASWVTAAIAALLIVMIVLALSNLAANTAKTKSIERAYREHILPEITRTLNELGAYRLIFDQLAYESLPEKAAMRKFLSVPLSQEEDEETAEDSQNNQED